MPDLKLKVEYLRLCAAGTLTNESAANCAFKVEERKAITLVKVGETSLYSIPFKWMCT